MAIETFGNNISTLNAANPTGADAKSTADDHIRGVKSVLLAQFPALTAPVTVTHTQINDLVNKAFKTGETYTGAHNYTGATLSVATPTNNSDATNKLYVDGLAFSGALPAQTGNSGKVVTTNGTTASWTSSIAGFTLTTPTITNPTITDLIETTYAPSAGTAFTVDWANGTIQKFTTSGNCTITLPAAAAGKGGTIIIQYGGVHTLTIAGGTSLKYPAATVPTATSVNGKKDVYAIVCHDATETLVQDGGRNF